MLQKYKYSYSEYQYSVLNGDDNLSTGTQSDMLMRNLVMFCFIAGERQRGRGNNVIGRHMRCIYSNLIRGMHN